MHDKLIYEAKSIVAGTDTKKINALYNFIYMGEQSVNRLVSKQTEGALFVLGETEEIQRNNVNKVMKILKAQDDFEYDYLPICFVKTWDYDVRKLEYCGKFEADINKWLNEIYTTGIEAFYHLKELYQY